LVNASGVAGYVYGVGTNEISLLDGQGHYTVQTIKNGAVKLFYDGGTTPKFETKSFGAEMTGRLAFTDNAKTTWGTGDDLQIYHDGGNSFLQNTGGDLYIRNNTSGTPVFYLQVGDSNHDALKATFNGAVELFYDNVKKAATASTGFHIHDGNLSMNDNQKVAIGASNDLQIWHNGTNSFIQNNTGSLYIGGNTGAANTYIRSNDGEINIACIKNGGVELYHDNSLKMETKSYGGRLRGTHWYVGDGATFAPNTDASSPLGTSTYKWSTVYATNGTIQTSDRNEKNTILQSDLGLSFIDQLKPVSYKFNNKDKTHYGLIAQDLEEVLEKEGKTLDDFAGIVKDEKYGLNYSELISPLIKAVQELSAKVAALEAG